MAHARGSLLAAAERRLNRRRVPECMTPDEIKKDLRSLEHKIVLAQDEIKKKQDRITLLKAEQARRNIDMSDPADNNGYRSSHPGPCSGQKFQQLLNRLHSITQRLLLCAFWAVLTFADVEKLAKLILENETTTFLLDFCMHACTAIPLLWARKPPTPSQAAPPPAQQLAARKSLISPSNETTVVAFSGKLKL
ncbi:hypothetical protein BDV34DRAFT_219767 [Aspergillus parasiticus]|uniref:Uncharacterized protein n=1 Tax=Aspergillus parasiticus TaxID=5067 RepID=A0A5N6E2Y6_ASPPA|nr:hypothetical protein BDV34DRAFT_219767 [Aspergillus parasiticus]